MIFRFARRRRRDYVPRASSLQYVFPFEAFVHGKRRPHGTNISGRFVLVITKSFLVRVHCSVVYVTFASRSKVPFIAYINRDNK